MPDVGRPRLRRLDFLVSAGLVLLVVGAVLWPRLARRYAARPTHAQCVALLERWVEHSIRAREPDVKPEVVAERLRSLFREDGQGSALLSCERELTAAEVECAVDAPSVDELERCLQ